MRNIPSSVIELLFEVQFWTNKHTFTIFFLIKMNQALLEGMLYVRRFFLLQVFQSTNFPKFR